MSASAFIPKLNTAQQVMAACHVGMGLTDQVSGQKSSTSCWDECEEFYQKCASVLRAHLELVRVLNNPELLAYVTDHPGLRANMRIMGTDLPVISRELADLHNLHKDKKGGSSNPDEVMHSIDIFQQYMLWVQKHEAVIMPVAAHLTEQVQRAELRMLQKQQEQDPTVVTDVEVKVVASSETKH